MSGRCGKDTLRDGNCTLLWVLGVFLGNFNMTIHRNCVMMKLKWGRSDGIECVVCYVICCFVFSVVCDVQCGVLCVV